MNDHKKIFQLCLYGILCLLVVIYFCGEGRRTDIERPTSTATTTIEQVGDNNCAIKAGIESAGQSAGDIAERVDNGQRTINSAKERIAKIRANLDEAEKIIRECQTILQKTGEESISSNPQ